MPKFFSIGTTKKIVSIQFHYIVLKTQWVRNPDDNNDNNDYDLTEGICILYIVLTA